MTSPDRFSNEVVHQLDRAKILGVRAGHVHRFTGVWVVVVEDRIFVRSWSDRPDGWFRAFIDEPSGAIQFGSTVLPVTGRVEEREQVQAAITAAFARKYPTPGSRKWVEGFAEDHRMKTTLELLPG